MQFTLWPWRWRQQVPPTCWYLIIELVTPQKTVTFRNYIVSPFQSFVTNEHHRSWIVWFQNPCSLQHRATSKPYGSDYMHVKIIKHKGKKSAKCWGIYVEKDKHGHLLNQPLQKLAASAMQPLCKCLTSKNVTILSDCVVSSSNNPTFPTRSLPNISHKKFAQ